MQEAGSSGWFRSRGRQNDLKMQTIPWMEKTDPWGKIVTLDIIPSENKALSDSQLSLAIGHELRPPRLPPNITSEKPRGVLHLHFAHHFLLVPLIIQVVSSQLVFVLVRSTGLYNWNKMFTWGNICNIPGTAVEIIAIIMIMMIIIMIMIKIILKLKQDVDLRQYLQHSRDSGGDKWR